MRQALIIFVRNPEKGKVKTRIAATTGDETALAIYKQLLQHTHDVVISLNCRKSVFYSDHLQLNDIWEDALFHKHLQSGETLGERMKQAFARSFQQGYQKVCIIGSDCYELTAALINKAFASLDTNDVVIGPATDGGYYLLGMTQMHEELFGLKEWSHPDVFAETKTILSHLHLSFHQLPLLADVDTEEDWKLYSGKAMINGS